MTSARTGLPASSLACFAGVRIQIMPDIKPVRVFAIVTEFWLRELLEEWVSNERGIELSMSLSRQQLAAREYSKASPADVTLIQVDGPDSLSRVQLKRICELFPHIRFVLVCQDRFNDTWAEFAGSSARHGFVSLRDGVQSLVEGIHRVADGHSYCSPSATIQLS